MFLLMLRARDESSLSRESFLQDRKIDRIEEEPYLSLNPVKIISMENVLFSNLETNRPITYPNDRSLILIAPI